MSIRSMSRRQFLSTGGKIAGAAGLCACAFPFVKCTEEEYSLKQPNIIFITADDLGWKDLSVYGNSELQPPNLTRLAKEGIHFDNAFVVASSCAPSRASFITGQYPHTHGVTGLTHVYPELALPTGYTTLASLLSAAGYVTGIEGKWHPSIINPPTEYGYTEALSELLDYKIRNSEKSVDFIRQHKDKPFYLELNYMNNHRQENGEFYFDPDFPVEPSSVNVPEYWTLPNWPEIKEEVAKFYSQTLKMDSMIGDVLDTLDELGIADNTLVLFVSDNGPPFPGNKMTLYDRGIGTPLIARWPRRIASGQQNGHLINSIDIMPTLLEAAGVTIPEQVQGKSFFSLLLNPNASPIQEAIYAEMTYHVHYLPSRAVRTNRYKYIKNYSDIEVGLDQCSHMKWAQDVTDLPNQPWLSPRVQEELYDLYLDPNEQTNLVDYPSYSSILEEMRKRLQNHQQSTNDPYLNKPFTYDYDG